MQLRTEIVSSVPELMYQLMVDLGRELSSEQLMESGSPISTL